MTSLLAKWQERRPAPSDGGFVVFAGQDWYNHGRAHADLQIAKELAKNSIVLVVSSIGMRMPVPGRTDRAMHRILRKARSTLRYLTRPMDDVPNLVVLTPLSVPLFSIPMMRQANAFAVALQVKLVARYLRLYRPAVLVVVPTAVDVIRRLRSSAMLYLRLDDHAAAEGIDRPLITSMEDELIEKADFVVYASLNLRNREADRVGDKGVVIDHGVELDHFTVKGPEPADMANIAHPRIGFFGHIEKLVVDVPLLERLSETFPDAQLVLVGRSATDISNLLRQPNVHFLGWRPYEDIPRYGRAFDVALCPMPNNRWIEAANPIKLKEYLALGLPVVSTRLAELERYSDVVSLASTHEEFIDAVRCALEPSATPELDVERRRSAVLNDGWDQRAESVRQLVADAIGSR